MKDRKQNIEITDLKQILAAENTSSNNFGHHCTHTYIHVYKYVKAHLKNKCAIHRT